MTHYELKNPQNTVISQNNCPDGNPHILSILDINSNQRTKEWERNCQTTFYDTTAGLAP